MVIQRHLWGDVGVVVQSAEDFVLCVRIHTGGYLHHHLLPVEVVRTECHQPGIFRHDGDRVCQLGKVV